MRKFIANGGPAFPNVGGLGEGLTMRDYFAAQALTGVFASELRMDVDEATIARVCFGLADAMLIAREHEPTDD